MRHASLLFIFTAATAVPADPPASKPQYEGDGIKIAAASAAEGTRATVSIELASKYLDEGSKAWAASKKCVACHTNGVYLQMRPALTKVLGTPSAEARTFFVDALDQARKTDREKLMSGIRPTQQAYVAAGLAEWDAHVTKSLSKETDDALTLLFTLQSEDGSFGNTDCWPPFESSRYHGTTVALMAAASAPGWLAKVDSSPLKAQVEKTKTYLTNSPPPNDYDRLLLLWTSTRVPGLLDAARQKELIDMVVGHQRADGGWSIRTFSTPEKWGKGNRAEKLRAEPDFANPASDGHQTGLAVIVLRDAGIPASDPRIQRGVQWLLANQRESGRWWTRSLNTDNFHFITYSGTIYPLLALDKCDALPKVEKAVSAR